jgi:hypothetical protein
MADETHYAALNQMERALVHAALSYVCQRMGLIAESTSNGHEQRFGCRWTQDALLSVLPKFAKKSAPK